MLRFVVAFFALGAAALAATSFAFEKEGQYKITFASGSIALNALRTCTEVGTTSSCGWYEPEEVVLTQCTRSKTSMQLRVYSMMSLGPFGGFLALVAIAASIPNSKGAAIARMLLMVLSFLSLAACTGLLYLFPEWLYCDNKPCDLITGTCENGYTLYFWLLAGACGSALLGSTVSIPAVAMADPSAAEPTTEGAQAEETKSDPKAPTEVNQEQSVDKQPENAENADGTAAKDSAGSEEAQEEVAGEEAAAEEEAGENDEDGDWVWDEESGMYWSDSAYMYLEPESGMYYDPNSGWWYDPESEEWIEPEGEGEEEEEAAE